MAVTEREIRIELARRGKRLSVLVRRRESFREFVRRVKPSLIMGRHVEAIIRVLQKVADGELKRVMIYLPPRHTKSELVSRLFTAYYLSIHQDQEVGLASYSASLAQDLSSDARDYFVESGGVLDPRTSARANWRTIRGGRMWAQGVGGSLTGKGFHLGVIDDPFKGEEDANSASQRAKKHAWYQSVFYTRQAPDAAIVLVNTRWHDDDLSGFLLAQEEEAIKEGDEGIPECWHIVNLPAIKRDRSSQFPATCTVEPDWRQDGDALDPNRFPLERLRRYQKRLFAYSWAALYQQDPVPEEGAVFKRGWFKIVAPAQVPALLFKVMGVDLAITEKQTADYTVAFPVAYAVNGEYYLFNPYREQKESPDYQRDIVAKSVGWRPQVIAVETASYQLSFVQHLRREPMLAGIVIHEVPADRDKVARARGWSPLAESGLVNLVDDGTGWIDKFLAEFERFPRSKNDDQVDAVGMAIEGLRTIAPAAVAPRVGAAIMPIVGLRV